MTRWSWKEYCDQLIRWSEESPFARLETIGESKEHDAVFALTVTDFAVPDDEKFHILISGLHVGGERSALNAAMTAIGKLLTAPFRKYLTHYALIFTPSVNPYGCFRRTEDQYHENTSGFDAYTADFGECWNLPEMTLKTPERAPELLAWMRFVDKIKPEILLDWHGANGNEGESMCETIGAAMSNHLIMPWGTRLLDAMRREICRGKTAVFDLGEYLERIAAPEEIRTLFPNHFRPSTAMFYPDMYPYIKCHTMPIVMEIGQDETGWRAIKGLMDYGLKLPPEMHGGLPVDHVGVDFGNIVIGSYGTNPGQRRISRCEIQAKMNSFVTFLQYPTRLGKIGVALTIGFKGLKQLIGDIPIAELTQHPADVFPADTACRCAVSQNVPGDKLAPLFHNPEAENPPETELLQNGVRLQMFIPIGHRVRLAAEEICLNGKPLKASPTDGYELIAGSDGWHLFINVPPVKSRRLAIYHIQAKYKQTDKQ